MEIIYNVVRTEGTLNPTITIYRMIDNQIFKYVYLITKDDIDYVNVNKINVNNYVDIIKDQLVFVKLSYEDAICDDNINKTDEFTQFKLANLLS